MSMKILMRLILIAMVIPAFSAMSEKKTKKEDNNPTIVVIRDGVKTIIPFSKTQTEYMNPDSIESISVNNDTMFIQLKSVRKVTDKSSLVKK